MTPLTAADRATLHKSAETLGVVLPPEAGERLERFLELLAQWSQRFRLTADASGSALVRQVIDSLPVVTLLPAHGLMIDVGSGAGFPGVVVACVRQDLDVVLLESRRRPTSFLRQVIRAVPLPHARALECRAESAAACEVPVGHATAVVARGIRLDRFLPLARPLVAEDGLVIAMQTAAADRSRVEAVADEYAFVLSATRDYELPGGERRRLLVFAPLTRT